MHVTIFNSCQNVRDTAQKKEDGRAIQAMIHDVGDFEDPYYDQIGGGEIKNVYILYLTIVWYDFIKKIKSLHNDRS